MTQTQLRRSKREPFNAPKSSVTFAALCGALALCLSNISINSSFPVFMPTQIAPDNLDSRFDKTRVRNGVQWLERKLARAMQRRLPDMQGDLRAGDYSCTVVKENFNQDWADTLELHCKRGGGCRLGGGGGQFINLLLWAWHIELVSVMQVSFPSVSPASYVSDSWARPDWRTTAVLLTNARVDSHHRAATAVHTLTPFPGGDSNLWPAALLVGHDLFVPRQGQKDSQGFIVLMTMLTAQHWFLWVRTHCLHMQARAELERFFSVLPLL